MPLSILFITSLIAWRLDCLPDIRAAILRNVISTESGQPTKGFCSKLYLTLKAKECFAMQLSIASKYQHAKVQHNAL